MQFDADLFNLFTQLSVIYAGTHEEWQEFMQDSISEGIYSEQEIKECLYDLVQQKIDQLSAKVFNKIGD